MELNLTKEQSNQIFKDETLTINGEDGLSFYFEFKNVHDRLSFDYCEIAFPEKEKPKARKLVFDKDDVRRITPMNYGYATVGNRRVCPSCNLTLIYDFDYCPKCGQHITYGE